ncbi:MAG: hypothetical protein J3K34DRAFT_434920 [Monoraphidium minutum]|nr:MAG: hypothetical protein J3K34DRAFT_434920 [Monoraphidium minutum]
MGSSFRSLHLSGFNWVCTCFCFVRCAEVLGTSHTNTAERRQASRSTSKGDVITKMISAGSRDQTPAFPIRDLHTPGARHQWGASAAGGASSAPRSDSGPAA